MKDQQQINLMNHFDPSLLVSLFFFPWEVLFLTVSPRVISWIIFVPLRISALRGCEPSRDTCFWLRYRLCKSRKWFSFSWESIAEPATPALFWLLCSAIATLHPFTYSYLHSLFHSPLTHSFTFSIRVHHETTPEPFTSYIIHILPDLPFCLKLVYKLNDAFLPLTYFLYIILVMWLFKIWNIRAFYWVIVEIPTITILSNTQFSAQLFL